MSDRVPDSAFFRENADKFRDLLAQELESTAARSGKVLVQKSIDEILRELDFDRLVAEGKGDLAAIARVFLDNVNHLRHPRYLGHQVAVPMIPSIFADLLAGATNNGMAVYEMGPAGSAVEKGIVRWMLRKLDWADGDGILTHGGSLGNLTALLAARARIVPESWNDGMPGDYVILASDIAHYSVERAAAILGLGRRNVVKVPVDGALRMHVEALKRIFKEQVDAGREVLAVVANAGATANGAIDPLREIGKFCWDEGLWLHVDGAHSAAALVSPRLRPAVDGIELADSLVWDTHKLLGTSALACATLFRDRTSLEGTFEQHAPYLYGEGEKPGEDLSQKTFECTKAPLGLKLFFNLAVIGEAGLAAHVERLFDQTRRFHSLLSSRKGFECHGPPQSNILLFRYGTDSATQDLLRRVLVLEGEFYITRTVVRREVWLRLVIQNPRTEESDIVALAERIEQVARGPESR
jgi:L-2,4-diaminobutyrate decarboxylase